MRLYGYGCPECGVRSSPVEGALTHRCLQVKCPACENVERIEGHSLSDDVLRRAPA